MIPKTNANRIIICSSVENDLSPIIADQCLVKQILLNLLSNAIYFTPQDGEIIISAYCHQVNKILLREGYWYEPTGNTASYEAF
ncbi:MAG: Sensory histidine kinase [Candidatus Tokpelaia sp. JSC188]|nr:MAG: Sensory histidine kinase [Candidatus Tokpelaia sp. JSC188]